MSFSCSGGQPRMRREVAPGVERIVAVGQLEATTGVGPGTRQRLPVGAVCPLRDWAAGGWDVAHCALWNGGAVDTGVAVERHHAALVVRRQTVAPDIGETVGAEQRLGWVICRRTTTERSPERAGGREGCGRDLDLSNHGHAGREPGGLLALRSVAEVADHGRGAGCGVDP